MNEKTLKAIKVFSILSKIFLIIYVLLDVTFLAFAITLKFNQSIKDMLGDFDVLRSFIEQLFVIAIWFCITKILDLIQKEKKFFVSPINTLIRTIGIIVIISATLSNTLYRLIYGLLNSDFTLMLMLKINIAGLVFGIAIMILFCYRTWYKASKAG